MKKSAIICVDDEKMVLTSLKTELKKSLGDAYNIETAEGGAEALSIIDELSDGGYEIPLIISDYVMPEIKGDEFLKIAHQKLPETNKIMLTGQATIEGVSNAINWANLYRYIGKPWEPNDFILTIKEAINSYYKDKKLEEQNQALIEINQNLELKVKERTKEIFDKNILLEDQKNKLNELYKDLSDSVVYAQRIQKAMLPDTCLLSENFKNSCIFFKPRDIVSGDFYWFRKIENHFLVAVADCTGHGVPGGFMSMLGISFLNEIVKRKEVINTAQVLDEMRANIITSLQQQGNFGEQKDGMDMGFLDIDLISMKTHYSGANHSLYIYRKKTKTFEEIKGDKMPIGIHLRMEPFTYHETILEKGDRVFMFSDGFPDQFGGQEGKKLKHKAFREMIQSKSSIPISEQFDFINTFFYSWKGKHEQIDDVTVIGIDV